RAAMAVRGGRPWACARKDGALLDACSPGRTPMVPARIACLDLDTFFVSAERLRDPSLVGKPVIVGHVGGRGVVTSASYEARVFGVKAGIPMSQALRLCPQAVVVGGHFSEYSAHAKKVREILDRYTPSVQTA